MVADELALDLVERYVRRGDAVLDPFCGSGRLLAAGAHLSGRRVGIDANPLACLLTRAKLARADSTILKTIVDHIDQVRGRPARCAIKLREPRQVQWFAPSALAELAQIINWVNRLQLEEPERLVVAVALSGAARDASYARKDGWKLHRLDVEARNAFTVSAWDCFERRLRYCLTEVSRGSLKCGKTFIKVGDAGEILSTQSQIEKGAFDVVLTSPPYGDSRTTVQYGAASALCLEFVSRIEGFEDLFATGRSIDARCLGGALRPDRQLLDKLSPYWAGRKGTRCALAVTAFLADYGRVCVGIAQCLKPGGFAVLIVGRRSTGGYRLKLDQFTIDHFEALGLRAISIEERRLRKKHLPTWINRYARCVSPDLRAKGLIRTMSSEIILAFRKPRSGR